MTSYDYKGKQFWVGKKEDGYYFSMGIEFGQYEDGFFATESEAAAEARKFIDSRTNA